LGVTPADQTVQNDATFTAALQQGIRSASSGGIVILGITPDKLETGYGQIQLSVSAGAHFQFTGLQFAEKPSLEVAKAYLAGGEHTWNSCMFVLKASA